jgi:hypothetical protein
MCDVKSTQIVNMDVLHYCIVHKSIEFGLLEAKTE